MIEIECPACEKTFTATDDQLGHSVICPHCQAQVDLTGDVTEEEPAAPQPQVSAPTTQRKVVVTKRRTTGPSIPIKPPKPSMQLPTSLPQQPLQQPGPHQQPPHQQPPAPRGPAGVVVTDIKIPMGSMVMLALKWMIACIPAMIVMWIIMGIFAAIFGGLIAGLIGLGGGGGGGIPPSMP